MRKKYMIIEKETIDELEDEVTRWINLGWKPFGNYVYYKKRILSPIETNLALNKPAEASNEAGPFVTADKTVDGNEGTIWRSGKTIAWLKIDLTQTKQINRIVYNCIWPYYPVNFNIESSLDNENWDLIYEETNNVKSVQSIEFTPRAARYVIFNLTRRNKSSYRVREFEIYGSTNNEDFIYVYGQPMARSRSLLY